MSAASESQNIIRKIAAVKTGGSGDSRRPHKLLLLLSLARIYKQDPSRDKHIPFDGVLFETFNACAEEFFPNSRPGSILLEYPFYHLTSDGVWFLTVVPGKEEQFEQYRDSPNMRLTRRRLLETVSTGYLDDEFDGGLRQPTCNSLVEQYLKKELVRIASLQESAMMESQGSHSLFAHEKAALDEIASRVKAHGLGEVLTNLELHDSQSNRYFEIDQVIISSCGVFVTELKHWSGHIEIRPNSWLQNNSFYKTDPHKANNHKAKLLRGLYERRFPSFPSVYFESVVVLTNPDVKVEGQSIPSTAKHNPTFDSIDSLVRYLKHQQKTSDCPLSRKQCEAFAAYVRKLHTAGPPRDFVFPGYEIVERLYQYSDRAEVIAKRTDIRHRRLCRLRIFFPPAKASDAIRRSAHERATNTLNAVAKIGEHPNVLKVWDIPNENNFIVEGSDWSETGTLRDLLLREGAIGAERATFIAVGLLRAIQAAYKEYVIHRSISPENVLMVDDTPKLMNFDLSFQLEEDRVTVIPDTSKLKRLPYIAPEIYTPCTVPEVTADLFSVGVLLYEMLTGAPPVKCSTDLENAGGALAAEHRQQLVGKKCPEHLIDLVFDLVQQNPSNRPSDAGQVLMRLEVETGPAASVPPEPNPQLAPGERCGVYEIKSFLRWGAESQIYRAAGIGGREIALKLFNRDVPRPRIVKEHQCSGAVHHPSLVRVDSYQQCADGRYCIGFEWIGDKSLRDAILAGERPDDRHFRQLADQMLDALQSLHDNTEYDPLVPLLHNDIKPDNILLGEGGRPVLVDFGAASEPRVGTYEGTEGYVAPDLRVGQERQFCQEGDLYALAVTLHEWLTGIRPTEDGESLPDWATKYEGWFRKGCHSEASERFASVQQMRNALHEAVEDRTVGELKPTRDTEGEPATGELEPVVEERARLTFVPTDVVEPNPFVAYLNSMHSCNAETDNALAEYQSVHPFFAHIHVLHPLAEAIEEVLCGPKRRHVIVTGHAGDGKSTIAVELYKRLSGRPVFQPLNAPLKRREDLSAGETEISLIKDYSEWPVDMRARLLEEMLDAEGRRFFLISNTGTLLEAFRERARWTGDWTRIESDLLHCMEQSVPEELTFAETPFTIINIAMMDNLGMAEEIFRRMLAAERWQACGNAECHDRCPIYRNVCLIRENLEIVTARLFLAYRRIYEYGTRLTLRQLCAHMAYMITSGLTYDRVVKMSQKASPPLLVEFMFFNRFFGDNGKEVDGPAQQLRAVRVIRDQEFGSQPCSTWERKLWLKTRGLTFQLQSELAPDDFSLLQEVGAGRPDDYLTAAQAREQVRRAVFFLHRFDKTDGDSYLPAFLRSVMLLDFMRWQTQDNESLGLQERNDLRRRILHVLQEHFTGVRLPEGMGSDGHLYITLSRRSHDIRQSAQVVLARHPEDGFQVRLTTRETPAGGRRRELVLNADTPSGTQVLSLSLPFLDYVMMRNHGEVGQDLQASYVDRLERFRGQLIRCSTANRRDEIMLVRLRTNHTFRRQLFAVRDDHLEVSDG